jgi:hypothetical protein
MSVVDRLRENKLPKDITDLCLKYMVMFIKELTL